MGTVLDQSSSDQELSALINDKVLPIFQWVVFTVVCQAIVVFGIGTNIINIICFIKQGFKDPVNVSLLGLALSDLGCLITLVWTNICFTPSFSSLDLPLDAIEFQYLISGIPHVTFTRVTAWITALITLERCMCITAPLKIKTLVTSKRVAVVIAVVFTILIFSVTPVYVVSRLELKFYPGRNKSLLGLVFAENRESVDKINFAVNNAAVPFCAFVTIIVCTIILVVKLKNNTKWREKSTAKTQADNVSNRNQKVAKMVVMISTLFIVCFVFVSSMFLAMAIEPQLSVDGKHRNFGILLAGFGLILESINSSANIFIYNYMSTKYNTTFRQMFCTS